MNTDALGPNTSPQPTSQALDYAAAANDYAAHQRTYRGFVRGVMIFVAHGAVILAFMAYFLT